MLLILISIFIITNVVQYMFDDDPTRDSFFFISELKAEYLFVDFDRSSLN